MDGFLKKIIELEDQIFKLKSIWNWFGAASSRSLSQEKFYEYKSLHKLAVFYGMGDPKEVYQSFMEEVIQNLKGLGEGNGLGSFADIDSDQALF